MLNYWSNKKRSEPQMYDLSQIILGAPAAQVSVERAFSALGLILTNLRTRLNDDTLQNILTIKLINSYLNKVDFGAV